MVSKDDHGRIGFSVSVLGAIILSIIYVLQVEFNQSFIVQPESTILVALVAAVGALLFYYGGVREM